MFDPREKIALFIDGANLYAASKSLGFDIDYRKLLKAFQKRGYLLRAYYYTALIEDQEYSSIRPLIDWLDYNGYKVVTKPAKEFTDSMGRRKIKGNMDIELAIDAMEHSETLDHLVLFSGDGDYTTLEEALAIYAQPKRGCGATATPPLRELGEDPPSGKPIVVKDGRFGAYVTDGEPNRTLPRDTTPESITREQAVELLAEKRASAPKKKPAAKKAAAPRKKAAAKK